MASLLAGGSGRRISIVPTRQSKDTTNNGLSFDTQCSKISVDKVHTRNEQPDIYKGTRPPITNLLITESSGSTTTHTQQLLQCLVEEKVAKVLERVALSDTERFCEITSRVSLSPLSDVLRDEVVSSEFPLRSTRRPETF